MAATAVLIEQEVTLGLNVANALVPLIKGVVTDIKSEMTPQGTVAYTVVINTDQTDLNADLTVTVADLIAINTALAGQNKPPLAVPTPPTPPTAPEAPLP